MRRFLQIAIFSLSTVLVLLVGSNIWIVASTHVDVFSDPKQLPSKRVGLVLGTSKRTSSGETNEFFEARIDAAATLYHSGKIQHILVSGDNESRYYNEPRDMLLALEGRGVPTTAITLDVSGLRTLDSIVRCYEIFGQSDIVIITQEFHAYRSLFIAQHNGMTAVCFLAKNPDKRYTSVMIRELIARPLAILDLYIWNTAPKYMGDKEPILLDR